MLYNNYKILLLTLSQSLLSSDVIKLKDWASEKFSIERAQNTTDVFFKLDEKGVINAEDLNQLRSFFQSIVRYDLLHMIDIFLLGDYSLLRLVPGPSIREASRAKSRYWDVSAINGEILTPDYSVSLIPRRDDRNAAISGKLSNNTTTKHTQNSTFLTSEKQSNTVPHSKLSFRCRNGNQPTAHEQQEFIPVTTGVTDVVASESSLSHERRRMTANPLIKTNQSLPNNNRNLQTFGSNGLKHSKPQRRDTERNNGFNTRNPDTSHNHQALDQDDNWLCSHYKRHCYVKFECCDKFWPCHRCHNNQSKCGRKKLKSRDTKMVKCVYCDKEQPFGEFCCNCNAKFANYFCGLCLHLTGKDDHPYHCEKCGICRIHGDRSFHCDVCGVCLDVQLRGNHKCREGSAHDECCICLEDAFTGCQILPCSHKVHKECATQMIRSGM
ncbi:zinc finger protein BRUTUS-like At1g74770 [Dendronephthya gigantea]|uniref:zinc finger protein BRUTUS-like At1g74770 n=1 Tax=Dendronephthya gigantea TaxID=151771 RepID=UPI00106A1076|nr:zinc finger protein BRUTUS-like At1g74770 [Dendronephthya gigantea]